MKQLFSIFFLLLTLFSCDSVGTNASYDIFCYVENEIVTETVYEDTTIVTTEYIRDLHTSVVGYAFLADTLDYLPASYQQALEGKISSLTGSKTISPIQNGSFDPSTGLIQFLNLTENEIYLFVLCDTDNEIYAYRPFAVGQGTYYVETYFDFQPYQYDNDPTNEVIMNEWIVKK